MKLKILNKNYRIFRNKTKLKKKKYKFNKKK